MYLLNNKTILAMAAASIIPASFVHAAGFSVNEQSASAMGSAFAGRASNGEDASIGAANPAGIALLDKQQITVGSALILEGGNFEGSYSKEGDTRESKDFLKNTAVPFGHYVLPVNDKFTFGLNVYVPFGLNLDYDDAFAGQYFGDKTLIENVNMQSTFAYQFRDNFSVGVGLTASHISGELTQLSRVKMMGIEFDEINTKVKGDDLAFTWNIGAIWQPDDKTTLGASYHAPTKFTLEGDVTATNMPFGKDFKDDAQLKITMPERTMFSVTHQLNDQWTVMADATWTRWSRLENIFIEDKENAHFNKFVAMEWRDVWAVSTGAAYKMNDQWTFKAGYMYDQSPTTNSNRTVRAPDNNRHWLTAGAKWKTTPNLVFDLAAAYVIMDDAKVDEHAYNPDGSTDEDYGTLTGEYTDSSTWILSAQMTYLF
ncbi:47 kDa outer membrane protein [invertebrate metagenome]|uniref:47 kDa outer membrane protein n=1 Tax=invertebrate metagenome TaxID=1711999 RepID=A0A2H9T785_9ZZZZ